MNSLLVQAIEKTSTRRLYGYLSEYYKLVCWYSCKESAGKYPYSHIPNCELVFFWNNVYHDVIPKFKKLAAFWGIEPEIEILDVKAENWKDRQVIKIGGWFNKNILTREMCRFLLNDVVNNTVDYTDLEHFTRMHYRRDYVSDMAKLYPKHKAQEKVTDFLLNMQEKVDSINPSTVSYEKGNGFLDWVTFDKI